MTQHLISLFYNSVIHILVNATTVVLANLLFRYFCTSGSLFYVELTALFNNMGTPRFKSKLMVLLFTSVNDLSGPLKQQNFTVIYFNKLKCSWFVICVWWILIQFVCFCVSGSVACDHRLMAVINTLLLLFSMFHDLFFV